MSVRRKVAGRVAKPPVCVNCGGGIPEQKPVFLLVSEPGKIVGPYHAGCAWKVSEATKAMKRLAEKGVKELVKRDQEAREETLPW